MNDTPKTETPKKTLKGLTHLASSPDPISTKIMLVFKALFMIAFLALLAPIMALGFRFDKDRCAQR